jgi:hypothetical protein
MPIHYFKTNRPIALLFYAPFVALAWLPYWIQVNDNQTINEFPFAIFKVNFSASTMALSVFGAICILLQAFIFNRIINRSEILGRESHLHGAVYILFAAFIYPNGSINDQMLSMFFILPALGKWWKLSEQRDVIALCFDSAILSSLAMIIYLPNALFILLIFSSLMLFRTFNLREAIYIFIGLTLPILFWFSFCFVVEIPYWNVATALISFEWKSNIKWIIFYSVTGFLSLISLLHYLGVTPQQVIKTRKMRSLVFIYLILAGLIMALRMAIIWEWTFPFLTLVPIVIFISGLLNKVTVSKLGTFLLYLSWATWLYASFS